MRIIDADDLSDTELDCEILMKKKKLKKEIEELNAIDNAPTVPNEYMRGYEAAVREYKRPTGQWIRKVDEVGFISHICSECGAEIEVEDCSDDKFCFNCGADMKGETK